MRIGWSLLALGTTLFATDASAQGVNLTGPYRCVALCRDGLVGQPAFVTQNGWNLNLLNEAGEPSRAWIDWSGHIWAEGWNQGAIFSTRSIQSRSRRLLDAHLKFLKLRPTGSPCILYPS